MAWRAGVDIGGTFTDIVIVADDGETLLWKEDTTPERPERAIEEGLTNVARELDLDLRTFLGQVSLFVHGSTIATNEIIQRRGPKLGLVCTKGFRDVLYFRDGFKWDRYNPRLERPADFVERHLRVGVAERIGPDGSIKVPLDEASVREAAAVFSHHNAGSIAVSLLWSHINPRHEQRVRDVLREELGDVPIMLSSEILPEIGEWVRTSATVMSAYVYPASNDYLRRLEGWLAASGLACQPLIMQVNGGCATVDQTLKIPVNTIGSGPAACPTAALQVGQRVSARDMIAIDMGGTSFDASLVKDGAVLHSRALMVAHQPIGVPGAEIHSIGAGGGSIAWIDSGGALRVGPHSAGAKPGPAAYDMGGAEPTVTDANIVLGYLSPDAFLGGRRRLRADLAKQAIRERIAAPLGLDVPQAAAGIIRVVNENMVNAIRVVSVQRGIDPRPFLLVAGGGAGALHAGRLAVELGIERVLIPAEAGVISAFGMTVTDLKYDYARTLHTASPEPAIDRVGRLLGELEAKALDDLEHSGFSGERVQLRRFVDARYRGQVHELVAPVPAGDLDREDFQTIADTFHSLHRERYGWSAEEYPVEYLHWRVTGTGLIERLAELDFRLVSPRSASEAARGTRLAYFEESGGLADVLAFWSNEVPTGAEIFGPALIDGATTTIVVFPGQRLLADGKGSFLIETGTKHPAPAAGEPIDVGEGIPREAM